MTRLRVEDQLAELQQVLFSAVDRWNGSNPHPLRSHRERASLNVTQVFTDASGAGGYLITIECALAGNSALTFHGSDLAAVAEHARTTLEHKIEVELRRRADRVDHDAVSRLHGIAV